MNSKALILGGKSGLLGQALDYVLKKDNWDTICPDRNDFDFFNKDQLREYILDLGVDTVFNTIAYTGVDKAEDEKESAILLNKKFPAVLGDICRKQDISLIHYSTDFVFNGKKMTPYTTEDDACPESIYGETKLQGEKILMANKWDKLIIIRTSWLFGPFKTNFVDKIIGFAKEKDNLKIVHDQIGSPTYTIDLAKYSVNLCKNDTSGLFHLANKGQASWCELASEAIKCAGLYCNTTPIPSAEYPQKAKRPSYSVLDCSKYRIVTGESPRPWIQSLREYIYNYQ